MTSAHLLMPTEGVVLVVRLARPARRSAIVLGQAPGFALPHVNRIGERTPASLALVDGGWYSRAQRRL